MARRFVRLKVALLRAGFRSGNTAMVIGTALGLLAGVLAGLGGLVAGALLRLADPATQTLVVEAGFALGLLTWVVAPLLTAGTDTSLDPGKLVMLPLRRRELAVGLTVAALVGPGGLATVGAVLGVVLGLAPAGPGALAVAGGGVLFAALCVLSSRVLLTLFGLGLRRRGVRDAAAVAVPLVVVGLSQAPNLVNGLVQVGGAERAGALLGAARSVLRFLPSSLPAGMVSAGRRGDLLAAGAEAVGAVGLVVALAAVWVRLLDRATTTSATVAVSRSHRRRWVRVGVWLPRLPARAAAVADKDLLLLFREPAQRAQVIMVGVLTLAAAAGPALTGTGDLPVVGYLGVAVGVLLGTTNANCYGYDGSSTWVNVAAGDDARADLLGKAVARLVAFTPAVAAVSLTVAVAAGPRVLLGGLGCALGAWFAALGCALVQSVVAPFPVTYGENGLMARNNGTLTAVVAQFVVFPLLALSVGPFVVLGLLVLDRPALLAATGAGGLLIGCGVGYAGYRIAVSYSAARQPELLQAVAKRAEA